MNSYPHLVHNSSKIECQQLPMFCKHFNNRLTHKDMQYIIGKVMRLLLLLLLHYELCGLVAAFVLALLQ